MVEVFEILHLDGDLERLMDLFRLLARNGLSGWLRILASHGVVCATEGLRCSTIFGSPSKLSSVSDTAASLPALSCFACGLGDFALGGVFSSQSSCNMAILGLCIAKSARGAVSVLKKPIGKANLG